ncbi:MAG: hypothetical protein WA661_13735, partial [Xanthobacteraceae bacterium]
MSFAAFPAAIVISAFIRMQCAAPLPAGDCATHDKFLVYLVVTNYTRLLGENVSVVQPPAVLARYASMAARNGAGSGTGFFVS